MLWNAYLYDPKTRAEESLGRVRARNNPAACLAAYRKFKIPAELQRRVGVRSVKPLPAPPPIPESEAAELRKITQAFNRVLGGNIPARQRVKR